MGTSKIIDRRCYTKKKEENIKCVKNDPDCMFTDGKGNCIAEWCIFDKVPKVITATKIVTCTICGHKSTVSALSATKGYICPECINKIKELISNE